MRERADRSTQAVAFGEPRRGDLFQPLKQYATMKKMMKGASSKMRF